MWQWICKICGRRLMIVQLLGKTMRNGLTNKCWYVSVLTAAKGVPGKWQICHNNVLAHTTLPVSLIWQYLGNTVHSKWDSLPARQICPVPLFCLLNLKHFEIKKIWWCKDNRTQCNGVTEFKRYFQPWQEQWQKYAYPEGTYFEGD
jgi:hypothetical protein